MDAANSQIEFSKFLAYFTCLQKSGVAETNLKLSQTSLPVKLLDKGKQIAKFTTPQSHFDGQNVWILKATGFNRGVGIHVFNKIEQL
jgi:hypothetical protein